MYLAHRDVSASSNGALSHGAIAGIVVGVAVFTAGVTFGFWTYLRKQRRGAPLPPGFITCGGHQSYHRYNGPPSHYSLHPDDVFQPPSNELPDQYGYCVEFTDSPNSWSESLPRPYITTTLSSNRQQPVVARNSITTINPWELEYTPNPVIFAHSPGYDSCIQHCGGGAFDVLSGMEPEPLNLGTGDTINPWELEYMPNPIIFAHLADCVNPSSNDGQELEIGPHPEVVSEQDMSQNWKRRMSDSSDFVGLAGHDEASAATPGRTKRRAYSKQSTPEPHALAFSLFSSDYGLAFPPSHTPDQPDLMYTTQSSSVQPEQEQASSHQSQEFSPASNSIVDDSTPASSAPSDGDQSLTCAECDMQFRTSGQRREHQNRKHIRRFKCETCERAFHLRSDLERHGVVHEVGDVGGSDSLVFKCPHEGCKTAGKSWRRKDNLARHVVRCRKALGRVA